MDINLTSDEGKFSNKKGSLLIWQAEILDEISELEKESICLLNKKELLNVKIDYLSKWSLLKYSQLKFKISIDLEQTIKDIARSEQKLKVLKELLKGIENEIQIFDSY